MQRRIVILVMWFWMLPWMVAPIPGAAQFPVPRADAFHLRVSGQVGAEQVRRWLEMPERVVREVARLAHGYDPAQALSPPAIEAAVAHRRAQARARALRDLLDADLNADGEVAREEIARIALALDGRARGLLWLRHRRADGDGDGRIRADELHAYAERRALRNLGEREAQALRHLMALDLDGDEKVTVAEAEQALVLLSRGRMAVRAGGGETAL